MGVQQATTLGSQDRWSSEGVSESTAILRVPLRSIPEETAEQAYSSSTALQHTTAPQQRDSDSTAMTPWGSQASKIEPWLPSDLAHWGPERPISARLSQRRIPGANSPITAQHQQRRTLGGQLSNNTNSSKFSTGRGGQSSKSPVQHSSSHYLGGQGKDSETLHQHHDDTPGARVATTPAPRRSRRQQWGA